MEAIFGSYFKQLRRQKKEMSLRSFCRKYGYDPGNVSKLERGKMPPPKSPDKLAEYAEALGIQEGSDEWIEFYDRAAAARGSPHEWR